MFSAVHPITDIAKILRYVRFVPQGDSCTAAKASLFNHLVDTGEQCGRHSKSERLSGLEVDDQLKFGGLLNRELSRFRSLENTINISRSLLPQVVIVGPIRNQAAVRHEIAV